jgi:hypothetical protein
MCEILRFVFITQTNIAYAVAGRQAPEAGADGMQPLPPTQIEMSKTQDIVDTASLGLLDLPFSRNQPWKPADDYTLEGWRIK